MFVPGPKYAQVSATGNVSARATDLIGIFVSSGTGSITIYDSKAAGTAKKIVDTFTPVPGTWYFLPFHAAEGLYIVLGAACSLTVSMNLAN